MNWPFLNVVGLFSLMELFVISESFGTMPSQPPRDVVVLIHGLGRGPLSMKRLEGELNKSGYQVVNLSYPSRKLSVEEICDRYLEPLLTAELSGATGKVHFVTHSLGGIVIRRYLADHSLPTLGRVVMLGPPNRGSEVVDCLRKCWLGRYVLGPSGCQLGTGGEDLPARLAPVDFDLGIIAGDRSWNPWFSLLITGRDDGKVAVESTKVEGMKDFLVTNSSHTWLMWHRENVRQAIFFLEHGRFER